MPKYRISYTRVITRVGYIKQHPCTQKFEAPDDASAKRKAAELVAGITDMHNGYELIECRMVGVFTQPTQYPRLSSAGLRGAALVGREQGQSRDPGSYNR